MNVLLASNNRLEAREAQANPFRLLVSELKKGTSQRSR